MSDEAKVQEREHAAALQEALGIMVQASGKGYAVVDYDSLDSLLGEQRKLREAIIAVIGDAEGQEAVRNHKMLELTRGQVQLLAAALSSPARADEGTA